VNYVNLGMYYVTILNLNLVALILGFLINYIVNNIELEKSVSHILIEIIEYIPNSVVSKTIIRKTTGNITVVASDTGEDMAEKISPFDTFIQVIEGEVEIIIDGKSNFLKVGQAIIIPAHTSNAVRANERFKMIATIIKSGYEDITI